MRATCLGFKNPREISQAPLYNLSVKTNGSSLKYEPVNRRRPKSSTTKRFYDPNSSALGTSEFVGPGKYTLDHRTMQRDLSEKMKIHKYTGQVLDSRNGEYLYVGDSKILHPGFLSPRDKKNTSKFAPTTSIDLFNTKTMKSSMIFETSQDKCFGSYSKNQNSPLKGGGSGDAYTTITDQLSSHRYPNTLTQASSTDKLMSNTSPRSPSSYEVLGELRKKASHARNVSDVPIKKRGGSSSKTTSRANISNLSIIRESKRPSYFGSRTPATLSKKNFIHDVSSYKDQIPELNSDAKFANDQLRDEMEHLKMQLAELQRKVQEGESKENTNVNTVQNSKESSPLNKRNFQGDLEPVLTTQNDKILTDSFGEPNGYTEPAKQPAKVLYPSKFNPMYKKTPSQKIQKENTRKTRGFRK